MIVGCNFFNCGNIKKKFFLVLKVTLISKGKKLDLAHKLDHKATSGVSDISIVIRVNPLKHNEVLTLSQMDMDFGLQTTVLFEQVYRAYRIINNHPYHK
ncbi:23S rRNA (pseudouridine1915-N3)-methyltransferase [Paenibacillus sp. CF095]|uniref:23S rRNA (pseudouridine(1915)-N(3))-methyltransferase RlmH n=1 Tax=Paenibacillus sp. CF095 TaxID=1881033 RepID=UPI0008811E83|nr:23S rRNA (pseudouridine1915-N3)-methyltransferase [Paenibacillus sp. CF095]